MNEHMIDWYYFSPRFWAYRLWWFVMGGATITVPNITKTIVVDHNHPLWWDCGARQVEVITDDPMWLYGPWLDVHVGKRNRDWNITQTVEILDSDINGVPAQVEKITTEIQFRKGKSQWANIASLMWT